MASKQSYDSPIKTKSEALRQLRGIRSDFEIETFQVCYEAAKAIHGHVESSPMLVKELKEFAESFFELVEKLRGSLALPLQNLLVIRGEIIHGPEQELKELLDLEFAAWKEKYSPSERLSAEALEELEFIYPRGALEDQGDIQANIHALRELAGISQPELEATSTTEPPYITHIRALNSSLNCEVEMSAVAWALKFDIEGWASRIAGASGPTDAHICLGHALRSLTAEIVGHRQHKKFSQILASVLVCTCSALELGPMAQHEFAILLVALNNQKSQVLGDQYTQPGDMEAFKRRKDARRNDLKECEDRVDDLLGPRLEDEGGGLRAGPIHLNAYQNPTSRHRPALGAGRDRLKHLSSEERQRFKRFTSELAASTDDWDYSEFIRQTAIPLLFPDDVEDGDTEGNTPTYSAKKRRDTDKEE